MCRQGPGISAKLLLDLSNCMFMLSMLAKIQPENKSSLRHNMLRIYFLFLSVYMLKIFGVDKQPFKDTGLSDLLH